jgi:hypothetical protein
MAGRHKTSEEEKPAGQKKEAMRDITPPREEQGTSDEVVMSGRVYYAQEKSFWQESADRQYIATPEDKTDLQHGVVTYADAATSDTGENEEIDRRLEHILKHRKKQPPEYDL